MITKAIVESVVDRYTIKVRVPRIDRTYASSIRTETEYLNEALICTLSNCDPNIQPGDIVFVALDDQNEDEAIILGYLYRETRTNALCDFILNSLTVNGQVTLPFETQIGIVQPSELQALSGVSDNISSTLRDFKQTLDDLTVELENMGNVIISQESIIQELREEINSLKES